MRLIIGDLTSIFLCWGPGLSCWMIFSYSVYTFMHLFQTFFPLSSSDPFSSILFLFMVLFFIFPFTGLGSYLFITWILRLLLPPLKPGVFDLNGSESAVWYLHFQLGNGLYVSGVRSFIFTSYLLRWLYFKAMGAQISWGVHMSIHTHLRELPLIKIGRDVSFGAYSHISAHTFVGDRILLAPVVIGPSCFFGMECVIGPKTYIGEKSWIGTGNRFFRVRLPPQSKIENFQYEHGFNKNKNSDNWSDGTLRKSSSSAREPEK